MAQTDSTSGAHDFILKGWLKVPYAKEEEFSVGHRKFSVCCDVPAGDKDADLSVHFFPKNTENGTAYCTIFEFDISGNYTRGPEVFTLTPKCRRFFYPFRYNRGFGNCIRIHISFRPEVLTPEEKENQIYLTPEEKENQIYLTPEEKENQIVQTKNSILNEKPNSSQLLTYVASLFQCEEWSDVTLCVQGAKFPAHRIVLAASSPVFASMFSEHFKESATREVEINDFNLKTISEMIHFMYTGEKPDFGSNVYILDLYSASDKYAVKELNVHCRDKLSCMLSVSNALDVLLLADMHNDDILKKEALCFICKNPSAVSNTDKCMDIVKRRPELLKDILECKHNK